MEKVCNKWLHEILSKHPLQRDDMCALIQELQRLEDEIECIGIILNPSFNGEDVLFLAKGTTAIVDRLRRDKAELSKKIESMHQ